MHACVKLFSRINHVFISKIDKAVLKVLVIGKGKFAVNGIAKIPEKNQKHEWFLFEEADQDPTQHPLLTDKIMKLRVKHFRNLQVDKDNLKPYLSEDETKFQFKTVDLRLDLENSISEIISNEKDDKDYEPLRKQAQTSTPKHAKKTAKTNAKPSTSHQPASASLSDFLKGHEIMKRMKLSAFDPYEGNAEEWISTFEKEFRQFASVNDIGFSKMLHLLKSDEGKKWHFEYRNRYSDWKKCKKRFVVDFNAFYISKLSQVRKMYSEDAEKLNEYADRQTNLWQRFFPSMSQKELNKAVISGLEPKLALQLSHYVGADKKDFLTYCGWVSKWEPQNDFQITDMICGQSSDENDDSDGNGDESGDDSMEDGGEEVDGEEESPVEPTEQLSDKEKQLAEKEKELADKEKATQRKEKELADKEKAATRREKELADKEKAATTKEKELIEKEKLLKEKTIHQLNIYCKSLTLNIVYVLHCLQ